MNSIPWWIAIHHGKLSIMDIHTLWIAIHHGSATVPSARMVCLVRWDCLPTAFFDCKKGDAARNTRIHPRPPFSEHFSWFFSFRLRVFSAPLVSMCLSTLTKKCNIKRPEYERDANCNHAMDDSHTISSHRPSKTVAGRPFYRCDRHPLHDFGIPRAQNWSERSIL